MALSHGHTLYWPLRVKSIEAWGTWGKEGQVRPVRGLQRHPIPEGVKDEVSGVPARLAAAQATLWVPSRPHGAPKSAFFIWRQLCRRDEAVFSSGFDVELLQDPVLRGRNWG